MKLHSLVDIITNSSAITYMFPKDKWEDLTKNFLDKIFINSGVDINFDDLFELDIILDQECSYNILNNYTYDHQYSLSSVEEKIIENFLENQKISIEDLESFNDAQIFELAKDLNVLLENSFRNHEIFLDGIDDIGIPYCSYISVVLKSKITGNVLNLGNEFLSIFEIDAK